MSRCEPLIVGLLFCTSLEKGLPRLRMAAGAFQGGSGEARLCTGCGWGVGVSTLELQEQGCRPVEPPTSFVCEVKHFARRDLPSVVARPRCSHQCYTVTNLGSVPGENHLPPEENASLVVFGSFCDLLVEIQELKQIFCDFSTPLNDAVVTWFPDVKRCCEFRLSATQRINLRFR